MLNFNTEPFYNDFDENNKFYSILFRPSVAVQARELNQLQTILQNQIKRQGDHIFKNGDVVIPGEFSINSKTDYIKLSSLGTAITVDLLIGKTVQNASGLEALVIHTEAATQTDPATLYVSYTKSASDNTTKVFTDSDTLSTVDGSYSSISVASSAATGFGSISSVKRGVYYINGYFVLCEDQTITLSKYSSTPTNRIGFTVIESTITADDEGYESLLDNAQGSYNYAAPGAHRYFIDIVLTAIAYDADDVSFVELGRVNAGDIISANKRTQYSELEKAFARRTYDESGDYTISRFEIDVREHRNNDRGAWTSGKSFIAGDIVTNNGYTYIATMSIGAGSTAPVHTSGIVNSWQQVTKPYYNRGIYSADAVTGTVGDESKLAIGFEPGKAYVQGYEIETISTTYVEVPKPRDTLLDNNASVATSVGSFVQVTNVHKLPAFTTGNIVSLYDGIVSTPGTSSGSVVGTCRVRGLQPESGSGSTSYVRMFIYDVKMNSDKDFSRDVKSFYYATTNFTANVTSDTYSQNIGIVTWSGTTNVITLNGVGTRWWSGAPSERLRSGDWIYVNVGSNYYNVKVASTPTSDSVLSIASTNFASANNSGSACLRIQTQITEPSNTSLLFPLPQYAIQSVTDHSYYILQTATIVSVNSNTLNISVPSGTLLPDVSNYYCQDASGNTVTPTSVTPSGSTAAIVFGSSPTTSYTVVCTVNKTGVGSRKTKTLTSTSKIFTTIDVNSAQLNLDYADCYKIVSITMGATDVTEWFYFDDGQRDSYYDYGSISLKPSYPTPSSNITVNYQYFTHSAGDFCDVGSYSNVDYTLINYYNGLALRDCIDFRPIITSSNWIMPKRGYNTGVDLTYYIGRADKITLNLSGNFSNIKGSPSVNPSLPDEVSNDMTMCTLLLPPYVFTSNEVIVKKTDNKRYTMRDIGNLEKRIDNIEYYTSLSLLEQETASLNITDTNGLDRFKNGFIVDNFTGHNIGNINSKDYVCSIDMENGELRPFTSMDNVNLVLNTSAGGNYKLYGDVITLPLNNTTPHLKLAENVYASRTEFVNPFAIFSFIGDVKMNPSGDEWFEVKRLPDIIQNVEGNFNVISAIAKASGILNTVWNAWQTQWAGKTSYSNKRYVAGNMAAWAAQAALAAGAQAISVQEIQNRFGIAGGTGPVRAVTTQVSAQQLGQARTGIKSSVVAKIDTKVVDDKIVSAAVIPYIRSRNILIQTKGLKPNTRFYGFFDNIDISSYCTPSKIITYTPLTGTFDSTTNSGIAATTDITRRINGDTQICLNIGDVIEGSVSHSKAVVVGRDRIVSNNGAVSYLLYVQNTSGSFTVNETLTGSISGATGTYLSISTPVSLISSETGQLNILFNIPNTDSVRFRTGSREFKLQDVTTYDGQYTSRGRKDYIASGTLQTKQATVVATRNAEIVQEVVRENRVITQTSERVVADTGWYDPLAQTFLVDSRGGAMLTKVDLFFASKDNNIPLTVEIREVVNGYPGKTVLPFSRVTVDPMDINLSSTTVTTFDDVSYPKYDTPTTVYFPSPVYVKDKTEYALVLLSDSNKYKVWISQMGDQIPGSSYIISEQPYAGVLFKSQNGSSWTADQYQDLKFTLWKANFIDNVVSDVVLTNDMIQKVTLESNPIQILAGSSTVRVKHLNHGLRSGDYVTFSGGTSVDTNITASKINQTYQISNPTLDSYTIVITGSGTNTAVFSGYIGGSELQATRSVKYETLQPMINTQTFSDTTTTYYVETTEHSTGLLNTAITCTANDNNFFSTPKSIPSGSTGKLNVKVAMSTTNPFISPLIDTHGTSAICVTNKIDSPVESTFNIAAVDRVQLWSPSASSFAFSGSTITSSIFDNQVIMTRIIPGCYIEISNATTSTNNGKYLVTSVNQSNGTITVSGKTFVTENSGAATLIYYYNSFFEEITPEGSSTYSKYVSNIISLANQASMIRIKFAVCCPQESDVLVYYKIGNNGTDFKTTNWTLFNPDKTVPKTAIGTNTFYDVDYTIDNLPLFDQLTVKLVMKSSNTAAVPRCKDLRIIACA